MQYDAQQALSGAEFEGDQQGLRLWRLFDLGEGYVPRYVL